MTNYAVTADGVRCQYSKKHLADHADVLPFLQEAVSRVGSKSFDHIGVVVLDMGRIIGTSKCVPTTETDDVFYQNRPHRPWKTRFVRNRKPVPCSTVTVIFKRGMYNHIRILTAFIGKPAAREPGDPTLRSPEEIAESNLFWSQHALTA